MSETAAARFTAFIRGMTVLVERERDAAALVPGTIALMRPLLRSDRWLPEPFATPSPESYRQYLLYCDPLER